MDKIVKRESNFNRKRIIENDYLRYLDHVLDSERNKQIVCDYANGESYGELALKYNLSAARIASIVANYIRHVLIYLDKNDNLN